MKIPPTKWGPHFWMTLHVACVGCQDYKIISEFVEGYKSIIPCLSCRAHFASVLTENPVPEAGNFFEWSVDVHNIVNRRLGKREFSYEEAMANIVSTPLSSPQFDSKIAIIIFLLSIILFLIFNRK